jgi:hypothetical protein
MRLENQGNNLYACALSVLPVVGLVPFIWLLMYPGGQVFFIYMCFIGYYGVISLLRPSLALGGLLLVHANYTVIRCGDPYNVVISGARTEMIVILIAAVLFDAMRKGTFSYGLPRGRSVDWVEVALYLYLFLVVLLSLYRFGVSASFLMSLREKALVVPIYSVGKYILRRDAAAGMISTVSFLVGSTVLALASLFNYYGLMLTPYPAYVMTYGSDVAVTREFFGYVAFRMDPLTSAAPGTTGMYLMLSAVAFGVLLLYSKPKLSFYFILIPCLVPLLWAAFMSLSFSVVIPLVGLAVLVLIYGEKNVGVAKALGLIFAALLVSIVGYAGYVGGGALSIASYVAKLFSRIQAGLSTISVADLFIGKGLDIRTAGLAGGGSAVTTVRTVSWDVGFLASLYELGVFAFSLCLLALCLTLKRAYSLRKMSRFELIPVAILIVVAGMLIIHGLPLSTRPVDVVFIFSMAVISVYYERQLVHFRN